MEVSQGSTAGEVNTDQAANKGGLSKSRAAAGFDIRMYGI